MIIIFVIIAAFVLFIFAFMKQEKFGKKPTGNRLEKTVKSHNFKDGEFANISHTPQFTEGVGIGKVMWDFYKQKSKRTKPKGIIPSVKTDLKNLDPLKNIIIWFGHSSYLLQVDGKKFLIDPVFSGAASPIKFTTKSFEGANVYGVDDMPNIDYLVITHDHWNHLDF